MKATASYLASIVALLAWGTSLSHAQIISIPIPNYNFSSPSSGNVISTASPYTAVTGYTFTHNTGNTNDAYGRLTGAAIGDPNIAGNTTAGFINLAQNGVSSFHTNALSTTIAADTTYTFSIDIGNPAGTAQTGNGTGSFDNPANVTFGLTAGPSFTPVGTFTSVPFGTIPEGTAGVAGYQTFTFSFTTGDSGGFIGQDLEAKVIATGIGTSNSTTQTYFDNLRLTAEAVPEPSAYLLMGMGFLALIGAGRCARRRC